MDGRIIKTVAEPVDFPGINYYTRQMVRQEKGCFLDAAAIPPEGKLTTMGWEVWPGGSENSSNPLPLYPELNPQPGRKNELVEFTQGVFQLPVRPEQAETVFRSQANIGAVFGFLE